MMKRTELLRTTPLRRTRMRPWRRDPEDKVPADVAEFVAAEDGMCVMAILDSTHICHDRFGNQIKPDGEYELDHIYTGGMGRRGPNTSENLVRLCPYAHRVKTESARRWRPSLGAWAAGRRERAA